MRIAHVVGKNPVWNAFVTRILHCTYEFCLGPSKIYLPGWFRFIHTLGHPRPNSSHWYAMMVMMMMMMMLLLMMILIHLLFFSKGPLPISCPPLSGTAYVQHVWKCISLITLIGLCISLVIQIHVPSLVHIEKCHLFSLYNDPVFDPRSISYICFFGIVASDMIFHSQKHARPTRHPPHPGVSVVGVTASIFKYAQLDWGRTSESGKRDVVFLEWMVLRRKISDLENKRICLT